MEYGVDLEYLGKKYLPNTLPPQPMDIDDPQLDNQIHQINTNHMNQEVDNNTEKKGRHSKCRSSKCTSKNF